MPAQNALELITGGLEGEADDLDSLEGQLTEVLRQAGQRALQRKLEGKKGLHGQAHRLRMRPKSPLRE